MNFSIKKPMRWHVWLVSHKVVRASLWIETSQTDDIFFSFNNRIYCLIEFTNYLIANEFNIFKTIEFENLLATYRLLLLPSQIYIHCSILNIYSSASARFCKNTINLYIYQYRHPSDRYRMQLDICLNSNQFELQSILLYVSALEWFICYTRLEWKWKRSLVNDF